MSGTRVTCEDVETGERESKVIENDWVLITDGCLEMSNVQVHGNGTVVVTIKRSSAVPPEAAKGEQGDDRG